jgi:hypothetical protein
MVMSPWVFQFPSSFKGTQKAPFGGLQLAMVLSFENLKYRAIKTLLYA